MPTITLRAYQPADNDAVLRMNEQSVHYLAPMDMPRLQQLLAWSAQLRIAEYDGEVAGFLVTFEDGSDYDSVNYQWFSEHLKRFVYIDRIVIDQSFRGKGIGQYIYQQLRDEAASDASALWLAAEIDIEPRNDYSLNFHQKQGFVEVASQQAGQGKQVSLQVLAV
jgi:predicted GNAT superfamily acetyltransferase